MNNVLFASFAMCAASVFADPAVALPPFTITGRIVNFNRQSVSEVNAGNSEIRAYRSDGTLVARSRIATAENCTENYRLVVPLATGSMPTAARVGETLSFQVQQQETVYAVQDAFTVDASVTPGGIAKMDVVAAADADGNGVADEYEQLVRDQLAFYRWIDPDRYGSLSGAYDKDADWDGDGASNFSEYVAGTNPFDEKDAFRILSFAKAADGSGKWELKFFANRDRAYTVDRAEALSAPGKPFARGPFAEGSPSAAEKEVLHVSSDYEVKTVFVLPAEDGAPSQFFKVNVQ